MTKTYTLGDKLPDGSIYLGCINDTHSSMMTKAEKSCTWDYAMANYTLPNRHEGLFIWDLKQLKPQLFENDNSIWLSETYKSYAYFQWLVDGHQGYYLRTLEFSVRAVRRFKSFNDLIISPHQAAFNDLAELESQTGLILSGLRNFIESGKKA